MPSHNWSKVNKTSELGSGKTSTVAFSCCLESGLASFFLSLPSWLLTAFSSPIRCSLDALGLAHSSPFKARAPLGTGLQNSSAYRALGWPMMSWPTLSICMFLDVLTMAIAGEDLVRRLGMGPLSFHLSPHLHTPHLSSHPYPLLSLAQRLSNKRLVQLYILDTVRSFGTWI